MAKNLVIVESPAKAKTIEGYLGKDFVVKSSYGHVRDLVKKGLAIDIEHDFQPNYEVSADKKQIVAELKKLAKEAEVVWLATDEDREGEAISWHLYETLNLEKKETKRITFNEITKAAILKAIDKPRKINQELVNAILNLEMNSAIKSGNDLIAYKTSDSNDIDVEHLLSKAKDTPIICL